VRSFFLFLSRQKRLRNWAETSALAQRLSSRFVAGETLDDALRIGRRVNSEVITITLDHLGESVTSLEEAAEARNVYLDTLSAIHENRICGNASLKLTQLGLDYSAEQCMENVAQLAGRAAALGSFVRVDMESSAYVDRTLDLVEDLHARYGCVGTVIQAYLYRSQTDVERLCSRRIRVRLVKGAYLEPPTIAFAHKAEVDRNFIKLMQFLLQHGDYPAIATHDEKLIEQTKAFATKCGISSAHFEFQMLYGIRRDLQRHLVAEGYRLRLYVPFGGAWYPYFMRRLAERPANVLFLARNLLRQ